jgi:hypothetical protein
MSKHECSLYDGGPNYDCGTFGHAIEGCYEKEDGTLWAGNGEYESQVSFCPYCGYQAKIKPNPK